MDVYTFLFEKTFKKPVSILFLILISLLFCASAIPSSGESLIKLKIYCTISFIVTACYSFIVLKNCCLPKCSKHKLGILFVFHAETEHLYKDAKHNLIQSFNSPEFPLPEAFEYICINSTQIKNYSLGNKPFMINLLKKTRCIVCVDINYMVDSQTETKSYLIKINLEALHPILGKEKNILLQQELIHLNKPINKIKCSKESILETLEVTSFHLNYATRYIAGLVSLLDGNYDPAYIIFNELHVSYKDKGAKLYSLQKCLFLSCAGMEISLLEEYNKTLERNLLDLAESFLEKMESLIPNTYFYHLDMANICFLKYRNIPKCKQHIEACRVNATNKSWLYSDAFITAYAFNSVNHIYSKYVKAIKESDYNIISIVSYIENILMEEPEKIGLHLALSVLYKTYNDTKLAGYHAMLFIKNYNFTKAEKNIKQTLQDIVAESECMDCQYLNCTNCSQF